MSKEQFFIDGSREVLKLIEEGGRKAGFGRGAAFEDFLTLVVCALAGQTMEEEYLKTVHKGYQKGAKGKRGIDHMTHALGELINVMTDGILRDGYCDVLGDIHQGAITYGEAGQFFTPGAVSDLMASLVTPSDDTKPIVSKSEKPNENNNIDSEPQPSSDFKTVCDPASGSGRILLSIAKDHRNWEFTGQDVDPRCARMTAINLGLHGLHGWSVWQNSLTLETFRVFKIGLNLNGGVIKEIPVAASPFNHAAVPNKSTPQSETVMNDPFPAPQQESDKPASQLDLF